MAIHCINVGNFEVFMLFLPYLPCSEVSVPTLGHKSKYDDILLLVINLFMDLTYISFLGQSTD